MSSYKDYKSLAMAPLDDIEEIIRPVGFLTKKLFDSREQHFI